MSGKQGGSRCNFELDAVPYPGPDCHKVIEKIARTAEAAGFPSHPLTISVMIPQACSPREDHRANVLSSVDAIEKPTNTMHDCW